MAVGSWSAAGGDQQPLAETLSGGTWTPDGLAMPSGATDASLSGVSCTSSTACVAVGHYSGSTGEERPLAATLSGGTWSYTEIALPGGANYASLNGVSCTGAGACVAAGSYDVTTSTNGYVYTHVLIETLSGGTWTATTGISPSGKGYASLTGISCTSSTACTAMGNWEKTTTGVSEVPLVESLSGTTWSTHVLGGVGFLTFMSGVTCTTSTHCVAVGNAETGAGYEVVVETGSGSSWTPTTGINPSGGSYPNLSGVSCSSTTACVAVGEYSTTGHQHILIETLSSGTWTPSKPADPAGTTTPSLGAVSCAGSSCEAAGGYTNGNHALVGSVSGGSVTATTGIDPTGPAAAHLAGVSCAQAGQCVGVGYTELAATGTHDVPFAAVDATGTWSGASLGLPSGASAAQLYGVSCTSTTTCVAVGYESATTGATHALVETLSGSTWTADALTTPTGGSSPQLYGVSCTSTTSCVAVGYFYSTATGTSPLVGHPLGEHVDREGRGRAGGRHRRRLPHRDLVHGRHNLHRSGIHLHRHIHRQAARQPAVRRDVDPDLARHTLGSRQRRRPHGDLVHRRHGCTATGTWYGTGYVGHGYAETLDRLHVDGSGAAVAQRERLGEHGVWHVVHHRRHGAGLRGRGQLREQRHMAPAGRDPEQRRLVHHNPVRPVGLDVGPAHRGLVHHEHPSARPWGSTAPPRAGSCPLSATLSPPPATHLSVATAPTTTAARRST